MKKHLSFLLVIFLLTGVLSAAFSEGHPEGKPWINPELPGNLPGEKPALEENYCMHVNYELYQNPPPGRETGSSTAGNVDLVLQDTIWNIVNTGETDEAKVMRILTSHYLDRERREKEGLEPLMEYVRRVRETKTTEELSALCREPGFLFGSPYATCEMERSRKDPARFALVLYSRQTIPVLQTEEDTDDVPLDTKRVEGELLLLGYSAEEAKQMTERFVKFDREMPLYDPQEEAFSGNNTAADMLSLCVPLYDQLVSQGLIQADGTEPTVLEIIDPEHYQYIQSLYRDENLDLFQAMICLSMIDYAADYLDPATYAKTHDISGEVNLKTAAYDYLAINARFLTEQAFADTCLSPEQLAGIRQLFEEYKQVAAEWMMQCDWLSEESRKNAVNKFSAMKVVVAASEERMDCKPLLKTLSEDHMNLLRAVIQYEQAERQYMLQVAGKPFERGHRVAYPPTLVSTNAMYDPERNTIYVMLGVLQAAMYDTTSRETLLASLGQTIGHEMSHGFDPTGIQHDAEGEKNCILTEEDQSRYMERAQRLVANLSSIELADGLMIDGTHKLFEEAADLLGLRLTLELAKKTEGFDFDQFFRFLAHKFFFVYKTRETALKAYASDPHPAFYVRVNYTYAQFNEFYLTYPSVQEGTGMYYPPEKRESLW